MQSINETQEPEPEKTEHSASVHRRYAFVPRWTVLIGILAIGLLYLALPPHLRFGPNWLLLAIEVVLLIPLMLSWMTGRTLHHLTIRFFTLAILGAVTAGLAASIGLLIFSITASTSKQVGTTLLRSAALLWCTNILVFALWYWEIDGGGPRKRHLSGHQAADLMFPQQADGNKTGWVPQFFDYLFVAFTGATALSPTDTYPLTQLAKMLMMTEAILSLIIIVLLAARAVNILGS